MLRIKSAEQHFLSVTIHIIVVIIPQLDSPVLQEEFAIRKVEKSSL
jgi:hypothetical protein